MTAEQMAAIHAAAFVQTRGWHAEEFTGLLATPFTTAFYTSEGFAVARTVAGESELLTIAVAPEHQRLGVAHGLMIQWIDAATETATTAFLEVAADNTAALGLYTKLGFVQSGLRKSYYARKGAKPADAVLMTKALTQG